MNGYYAIAIDGPGGAGKSSMARRLAAAFSFLYVDTGAIYRTLSLACIRAGLDRKNADAVMGLLSGLEISIRYNAAGEQCMFLNGEDVSDGIRQPDVSLAASEVSSHASVRACLLEMQRRFARESNVIMDGRDIGTVVLPDADLKIFLTASLEARSRRRLAELLAKGEHVSLERVMEDMRKRDEQDISRSAAPLKKADDAVVVDTSELNADESFELLSSLIIDRLSGSPEEKS